MTRVLHVLAQKPGETGSGVYLRSILREAARSGIKTAAVVGVSTEDPDLGPGFFRVNFDSERLPFSVVGMSDVMPYRSTRWDELSEEQLRRYRQAFLDVVEQAVLDFRPDIIHCHHLWCLTALVRETYPERVVVASSHGTGLRQARKLPNLWARWLPRLQGLDHVFCLTPEQWDECESYGLPCSLAGAGFDSDIFHPTGRPEQASKRALFAGKLSLSKGCRELLTAFEPLRREGLAHLALAGSGFGPETEELQGLAVCTGAELLGRLTQQDLAAQMRASDLFVLPSYYEGLPLVVAEALACGCRVVANRLPGLSSWLPEDITEGGWVTMVDMPALVGVDQPSVEDIPCYVDRLGDALRKQFLDPPAVPPGLALFLQSVSWRGVWENILRVYRGLI